MKLVIYTKSGNKIVVRGVKRYEVNKVGDDITKVVLQKSWWYRNTGLLDGTLSPSQIEAICVY